MELTQFTGIAGLGILAACWRQARSFFGRLRSFFVVRGEVQAQLSKNVLR